MSSDSTATTSSSVESSMTPTSDETSSNATNWGVHQGSDTTAETTTTDNMSTQLLIAGIVAGSVVVLVIILFMIRARRRRNRLKSPSLSNLSAFQGVTSTTAMHNTFEASAASTASVSPQGSRLQTFKLPRRDKSIREDHIALEICETPPDSMPPTQVLRITDVQREPSRSSFSWFTAILSSRSVEVFREHPLPSMDSAASTISFAHTEAANAVNQTNCPTPQQSEGELWRDLSETCWSIGPDSDSESEDESDEHFSVLRLNGRTIGRTRSRLSTLSDDTEDSITSDSDDELDTNSLNDSSPRRGRALSPLRERSISSLGDSSPRRIRGLSALDMLHKDPTADKRRNYSVESYFSADSDFYDETIRDCSNLPFSDVDSDSDDDIREEWF